MPVEIQNFHSALRKEMISIITVLGEFLSAKKRVSNSEDNVLKRVEHTETGSTDSVGDAALICEDFLTFLAVLTSHTDSEDALIFPVLVARIPDARARLAALDDQHSKINSTMHILKSQLKVFPDVHSEAARFCILEDIFTESTTFKSLMLSHLDLEEQILHPLMMDNMSVDEVNVIVGRVLGHRSSDMMEKILKLMYRHLSADDFAVCLDSIQKSVSGTFFEKWLSALPERVGDTRAESESVLSSIFEIGSIVSEGEQVFQNNTTVAGVMSGAIPDLLREQVLEILRKDYDDPVHYSLENVIRQENARLLSKSTKRKRKVNLADLTESKRVALRQSPTEIIPNDTHKSYFSVEDSILGCPHYRKKCKIVAPCCSKVYVCRLCHNEATDDGHTVDR